MDTRGGAGIPVQCMGIVEVSLTPALVGHDRWSVPMGRCNLSRRSPEIGVEGLGTGVLGNVMPAGC